MSANMIEVQWEFNVTTDSDLQSDLGLTEGEVYEMLDEEGGAERLNALCCDVLDVPRFVNLDLFFESPRDVSDDEIAETLSNEYGWAVDSFEW